MMPTDLMNILISLVDQLLQSFNIEEFGTTAKALGNTLLGAGVTYLAWVYMRRTIRKFKFVISIILVVIGYILLQLS